MNIPLNVYQFINLTNAILSLIIAAFVLLTRKWTKQIILFSLFAFFVFLWDIFYFLTFTTDNFQLSAFLFRTCMIAGALILPTFTEFVFELVNKQMKPVFRILNFGITFIIILTIYSNIYALDAGPFLVFPYWPIVGFTSFIQILLYGVNIYFSHKELFLASIHGDNKLKQQAKIIIVGTSLGYIGAASNFLLWFRIPFPPILNILIPIYVISVAYAITKHEFMDIRVAITRGAAYGTTGFLLVVSFMALNLFQMPQMILFASNTALCLVWVFFADRMRSFIQTPLEEKWITGWYDSNKLLNRISQKLVPVLERTEVFNLIADELRSTIKINRIDVKTGESGHKYDDLEQTKEGLIIPLSSSSGLEGLLVLGPKISEDPYDEKDLTLFRILLNQAVLIFDRMKPYEQIKHEFDSTQKKLFETEKMLSRSARLASLGTLTAGVTHEIRNPLGVIRGSTEDISKTEQNKESIAGFQKLILTHVDRIANIVDKMLYLSKSKEAVNKEIDVNKLIEQYIIGLVSSKNAEVLTQLNPVPNVLAIEDDLHQVLINLTSNAIKAMPNGGTLTIKTYEAKENGSRKVVIEVSDTGVGIPPENLEKIFDPFFSTWENGTGLGLSISYKIIEELKGRIEVQSQVGKGSTFKIILPAV